MKEVETEQVTEADLDDPVFVEGLPGVGQVGKLAVEHVLEELDGELVYRVFTEHFPPQVTVDDDGRASLAAAEVYAVETEGRDLLVLTGDHQAQDAPGHYRVTEAFLDIAEDEGAEEVFALGGVPTGELVEEYGVLGAYTDDDLRDTLAEEGVEFTEDEPSGGIVGTSGLLLGLGERRGFRTACLMGETSGYLVDPKSAQAVLEILQEVLGFEVDFADLEDHADEMEDVMSRLQEMEGQQGNNAAPGADDDLRYIG